MLVPIDLFIFLIRLTLLGNFIVKGLGVETFSHIWEVAWRNFIMTTQSKEKPTRLAGWLILKNLINVMLWLVTVNSLISTLIHTRCLFQ